MKPTRRHDIEKGKTGLHVDYCIIMLRKRIYFRRTLFNSVFDTQCGKADFLGTSRECIRGTIFSATFALQSSTIAMICRLTVVCNASVL